MKHKYGTFTSKQIKEAKRIVRKNIFFLLLCVDPQTKQEYENIDVNQTFRNVLQKISGMNELLFYPPELVITLSLLEAALIEYNNPDFDFYIYRKLVLDAGSEIAKVKEVDSYAKLNEL